MEIYGREGGTLFNNSIGYSKLNFIWQKIGQGAFSDVHKAIWTKKDCSQKVALKKIRDESQDKYKERETKYLSKISHENIVTLYGISNNMNFKLILILEYSQCGSLHKYLHLSQEGLGRSFKYSDSLRWMHQLALVRLAFISFPLS